MCGIAGIYHRHSSARIDPEVLRRMTDRIAHRGPDGSGVWVEGPIGLGHRRLAIIDVASGQQPMADLDQAAWIVFNGEIYNFQELRTELGRSGRRFATQSDTEVILQAYRQWGTGCVERLRGMFAFAIWEPGPKRLFLARDRVGKKPLYWTEAEGAFLFASEAKALLAHPAVSRRVSPRALAEYLTYQYVPEPGTIFEGMQKLPPAHWMLVDAAGITIQRYWDLEYAPKAPLSDDEVQDRLRGLLTEAVGLRLISEVPLGAFLSGGVDSSIVVSLMARQSAQPVRTFSIGFEHQDFNELPYARMVAERYGTIHQEFICTADLVSVLPDLVYHLDEPFADSSAVPTYYLSQLTRRHVTVALNGDGGDESFGGYERYLGNRYVQLYSRVPESLRRHIARPLLDLFGGSDRRASLLRRVRWLNEASLLPPNRQYAAAMTIFRAEERRRLITPAVQAELGSIDPLDHLFRWYDDPRLADPVDRMLCADTMTYLPGDLLVKVDRMTMAHGLEGRSPLLDHKVLEFAARLPGSGKIRGSQLKFYLKRLGEELLPRQVLHRPKQGFGVPIGPWFRGELKGWVTESLRETAVVRDGLLEGAEVDRFVQEHTSGSADHGHRLWSLLCLENWYRLFILGNGP